MPGSSQRYLDKSRTLSADCVLYDLEDSVTPARKAEARAAVRKELDKSLPDGIRERGVRVRSPNITLVAVVNHSPERTHTKLHPHQINSVGSGLALGDLTELLESPSLTTIMLPKTESASDLTFIADVIAHSRRTSHTQPISILALIESARSLSNLSSIASAAPGLLSGLCFAAEDFALDLSLTRTPDLTEFLFARSAIATACRAHDLPSTIDLVTTAFKSEADQETLLSECRNGKRMGFNGKQCIHPGQVGTVSKVFSPEMEEVKWAVRVGIAQRVAEEMGKGAWALDGKMIDAPVEGKARAIVAKAELCGFDVESLTQEFKDVKPE